MLNPECYSRWKCGKIGFYKLWGNFTCESGLTKSITSGRFVPRHFYIKSAFYNSQALGVYRGYYACAISIYNLYSLVIHRKSSL
ncbi:hypothetical protein ACN38_g4450 [Penicillium nordicum]|uniref:Uncharacterized protein n=1 Tax=Penicillium nordicum TaxID=229535 RepID=A0A0M8PBE6_9EURO|nr:hypothetical protein ACN38_g4450 [Penicillium nordicum]